MHCARWPHPAAPRPRARRATGVLAALAHLLATVASPAAELTVSAAASLGNAFREIGAAFAATRPATTVRFNFAASGALLQQIAQGAPVDVFASADEETMAQAVGRGLVAPAARAVFARNTLVVIVPSGAQRLPRSLADLAAPSFRRLAIGVPASVPAGRYARAALERAGLWPALAKKAVGAQSVRQALDYVARGEVEAGFVYATDAMAMADKVQVAFAVPTATPVRYPIAAVAASANAADAQAFVAYLLAPPAQAILRRQGFAAP
jgi:molybdate transport system substrate-binding protein